jgi:tetratricopeptide (TPR) repeat protein
MITKHSVYLLWLVFTAFPVLCSAQSQFPIKEWKEKLSVKEDIGYLKQIEVGTELHALDPKQLCQALQELKEQAKQGNSRFRIKMALISVSYMSTCKDSITPDAILEQALRECYELNDDHLAVLVHEGFANLYSSGGELGLAIVHKLAEIELMEKEGLQKFRNYAFTLYATADLLYHSDDYRAAVKLGEQALRYRGADEFNKMDSLDQNWQMNAWNVIGLSYKRLLVYDSAMIAFDKAYNLAGEPFWKALLKGNRGDVFFLQGKYDSAEALLRIDYKQSLASGDRGNASITIQRLARITTARGDLKMALSMIRTADSLERHDQNRHNRAEIMYSYALIFKDLGMADSSFAYMEKYQALKEYLAKDETEKRVEVARLRLVNQENINEITSLRKDKNRIILIRNFSIALILLLAAFGFVYINRMRLQSRLKQQEANEAKRKAELEASHAKEQLNIFTESLLEKTKQIEELKSRSLEKEHHQEQIEQMQELAMYTILTDEDWERFKKLFTKVYPGFFIELKQHVPDITLAEQRMAALIKLNIPNKEAAGMLGISQNSIYKTRQRLRQRLGIEKDDEMDMFFREKINPV